MLQANVKDAVMSPLNFYRHINHKRKVQEGIISLVINTGRPVKTNKEKG